MGGSEASKANGCAGGGASPLFRTLRPVGVVWMSKPMRVWRRGLNRSRKRRPPRAARLPSCCPCACAGCGPTTLPLGSSQRPPGSGLAPVTTMNCWGCILVPALKKLNELSSPSPKRNPALHSRFVELSEAYQVLSREQSRRSYDHQLRSAASPKCPGTTAHPRSAHQGHSSSWAPPNAKYWAQFHEVRPQGPESRQQQYKHNRRVLGYCLLIMLAGMGLHYVAFRKLEQMHRSFMDEKDRIITAIYNDTRARARANRARLQEEQRLGQQLQPPPGPPQGPGIVPPGPSP
ncbi:dnaJ homolog subfamily C member 4 isoform X3 [Neophocaena asiaeorientalis asiaeorientalis]|uniref:DnaJ homolog subfamily C member 4 isoform X3 n=1 Tax=Neophocaena asiaeorientalis asiaeorientalis TaxID=1706337 RepID=A0A341BTL2_NEOAA|nr:dnaJ homolog subfamily C member 4 isoform X3 [Neophocaena asiaeorientalis asiaeorientalis]